MSINLDDYNPDSGQSYAPCKRSLAKRLGIGLHTVTRMMKAPNVPVKIPGKGYFVSDWRAFHENDYAAYKAAKRAANGKTPQRAITEYIEANHEGLDPQISPFGRGAGVENSTEARFSMAQQVSAADLPLFNAMKVQEQAKHENLKRRKLEGSLISREEVDELFLRRVQEVTRFLDNFPRQIAVKLVGHNAREIETLLRDELNRQRDDFARDVHEELED